MSNPLLEATWFELSDKPRETFHFKLSEKSTGISMSEYSNAKVMMVDLQITEKNC